MIYVLEAIDAAGKATQARRLADRLGCQVLSFPDYSSLTGRAISEHLRGAWNVAREGVRDTTLDDYTYYPADDNALVRQSLMLTNRMEHWDALALASGAREHHLVLDRYWASGLVYGRVEGLDRSWLELIHRPLPKADHWLLLDIPVEESFRRRPMRRDANERDRKKLEFVAMEYRRVWVERGWNVIDGVGTVDEVAARVRGAVGL